MRVGQDALHKAGRQVGTDAINLRGKFHERGQIKPNQGDIVRRGSDRRGGSQVTHTHITLGHLLAHRIGGDRGPCLWIENQFGAPTVAFSLRNSIYRVAHSAIAQSLGLTGAHQRHPATGHTDMHAQGKRADTGYMALKIAQLAQQIKGRRRRGVGMIPALKKYQQGIAAECQQIAARLLNDLDHRAEVAVEGIGDDLDTLAPKGREPLGKGS